MTTNNVVAICEKVAKQHRIADGFYEVVSKAETRFYGSADELLSIFMNRKLLTILPTVKEFEEYLASRPLR